MSEVDDYIARFPREVQKLLTAMRRAIRGVARGATERISYGIPTFDLLGTHLVHYAAFKEHIGFYPTGRGMLDFKAELAAYPTGRGSVQFAFDAPLPLDLVRRIVRHRLATVEAEAVASKRPARAKRPAKKQKPARPVAKAPAKGRRSKPRRG